MFLRCKVRRTDGKQHRYGSVVENTRVAGGRVVQRHVLDRGEINDLQELAWRRSIEVLEEGATPPRTLSLFPEDRCAGARADAGNTADKTMLRGFLERIERQCGKARRVWLMDRGVPTEEGLAERRAADPPVDYPVGTPKFRLTRVEKHLVAQPWQQARPGVQVKLLAPEGELYVLVQSRDRVAKERAMRRRQLKRLWARLKQLSTMRLTREELLMKLGAARDQSRTAWRLVTVEIAAEDATFRYRLDRNKLRQTRLREGRYLLRTNLLEEDPAKLWGHYLLLMAVEEAFKNLKGDLAIRPVIHQLEARIEAHVFIAFLAYCLHVALARGLTPRSVLEKFAAMQMIDVHLPTTDGRELVLTRYTEPEPELSLLLKKL